MPYYLRYISSDSQPVTLDVLASAVAPQSQFVVTPLEDGSDSGEIKKDATVIGEIEISRAGDASFDDDIEQFTDDIQDRANCNGKAKVLRLLGEARFGVVVRVFQDGSDTEASLELIRPLWDWLFANRKGLLRADGEGYFEGESLILQDE